MPAESKNRQSVRPRSPKKKAANLGPRERTGIGGTTRDRANGASIRSVFLVLRDAVDGFVELFADLVAESILHQKRILAAILVERS